MALSFSELRANRTKALDQLNDKLKNLNSGFSKKEDERLWQPTVDKNGNGYAVIRFLPAPEGEDDAFVRVFDHGFKGPAGKWYIEVSRTTIGEEDPVGEMNSKLWEQGEGSKGRLIVSGDNANKIPGTKRRTAFVSNILVIDDPENPDNNGKVFLFRYGKKLFDKLNSAMNPKFKDEEKMNPFDLWEGCNFKIKIRKVEGQRNYDSSEFDRTTKGSPNGMTDSELEKLWKSEYKLQDYIKSLDIKSYDELQKKLNKVMDINGTPATRADTPDLPTPERAPTPPRSDAPSQESQQPSSTGADDDDESLEFFKKLGG